MPPPSDPYPRLPANLQGAPPFLQMQHPVIVPQWRNVDAMATSPANKPAPKTISDVFEDHQKFTRKTGASEVDFKVQQPFQPGLFSHFLQQQQEQLQQHQQQHQQKHAPKNCLPFQQGQTVTHGSLMRQRSPQSVKAQLTQRPQHQCKTEAPTMKQSPTTPTEVPTHDKLMREMTRGRQLDPANCREGDGRPRVESPSTSSTGTASGENEKTSSSDENHSNDKTPPNTPPSGTVFPVSTQFDVPKVVVVAAPASEPPTPPLSSVDEEDWLQVQPDNWDVQSVQSYKVNKNIVAQQAMGSTSTLVEAAETAMRTALATAEAMAERRRCGAAGNKHSKQNRPKSQRMAHRSRSCGVAKVNEAMSEEATVRAVSVERNAASDYDFPGKGVPGIWDSALMLIHSARTGKDAKSANTPTTICSSNATAQDTSKAASSAPKQHPSLHISDRPTRKKASAARTVGMFKMVQSDFARLEKETKIAEVFAEVKAKKDEKAVFPRLDSLQYREAEADVDSRESRPAATSEEREDSFERWRRELRLQAGLDEMNEQSLRSVVRDSLSGTI